MEDADLVAVPFLAVGGIRLAADMVADARGGEQVAFIGRVDEHLPGELLAGEHRDLGDASVGEAHALGAVEPLVAEDGQAELLHVILEDFLGHARFEDPHRALVLVHRDGALTLVAELRGLLPLPGLRLLILDPDAVIEVAGETADDGLVARVGVAQAGAAQAAEVDVGADDDDRLAHLLGLDGGDDPGGSAAVDDDVVGLCGGEAQGEEAEEGKAEEHGDLKEVSAAGGWRFGDNRVRWVSKAGGPEDKGWSVVSGWRTAWR